MPGASLPFPHPPASQPQVGRLVDTQQVDRALAAGLLRDFLTAIEAEGGTRSPFMAFAQARAEAQLADWDGLPEQKS